MCASLQQKDNKSVKDERSLSSSALSYVRGVSSPTIVVLNRECVSLIETIVTAYYLSMYAGNQNTGAGKCGVM